MRTAIRQFSKNQRKSVCLTNPVAPILINFFFLTTQSANQPVGGLVGIKHQPGRVEGLVIASQQRTSQFVRFCSFLTCTVPSPSFTLYLSQLSNSYWSSLSLPCLFSSTLIPRHNPPFVSYFPHTVHIQSILSVHKRAHPLNYTYPPPPRNFSFDTTPPHFPSRWCIVCWCCHRLLFDDCAFFFLLLLLSRGPWDSATPSVRFVSLWQLPKTKKQKKKN